MDISYNELKDREVINLNDGSRMGHIVDLIINFANNKVSGMVVPGERRLFRKSDDIFIPIEKIRRIGDDVILVRVELSEKFGGKKFSKNLNHHNKDIDFVSRKLKKENGSFIRYRKMDNKKYK